MNQPSKSYVLSLIASVTDGRATENDVRELEHLMRQNDADFELFLNFAFMNAQLGLAEDLPREWPTPSAMQQAIRTMSNEDNSSHRQHRVFWKRRSFLAASAAIFGGVLFWPWFDKKSQVTILESIGPKFLHREKLPSGNLIGQSFQLEQGIIQLNFPSADASIVVEAPAHFAVLDKKTLRVKKGRISATVQDGQAGIRILTPEMDILDLGTRFAVDVTEKGTSEVHVFEGKVEVGDLKQSQEPQLVRANEAFSISQNEGLHTCELRTAAFIQPDEIVQLTLGYRSGQAERADRALSQLQRDASCLATISATTIDACKFCDEKKPRQVQGRFPGRQAFDFVDPDDAIRLNWEPHMRQFTLMTWVRLNQTLGELSAIYNTNEWDTVGQIHWMLDDYGRMKFAIHSGPQWPTGKRRLPTAMWVISKPSLKSQLARWVHLAVSYDMDSGMVRMYVNGAEDIALEIKTPLEAVLGPGEIGNWRPIEQRQRRRFSGRMDEFLVFSRALPGKEIQSYYESSTPYL